MKALIISDVHGNIESLRTIEKAAGAVDRVIFLGDAVDYGPQPRECIQWMRDHAWHCLRGNHDNAVLTKMDCRCGQSFHEYSVATREYMWKILEESDYKFMESFEPHGAFELYGKKIRAYHASPTDPLFKYMKPEMPDDEVAAEVEGLDADIVLLGHTHFPMDREAAGVRIVNPGSAGQPRDGDPRVGYAIWNDGDITLHRLEYDVDATCRMLDKCDMERRVIDRMIQVLRTGK